MAAATPIPFRKLTAAYKITRVVTWHSSFSSSLSGLFSNGQPFRRHTVTCPYQLDRTKASPSELRGEALFNGKARCAYCHPAPYYTDNSMHNLMAERFYKQEMVNGMMMDADGPIKTFPLRGIKDSPPYLHDGRCFTLEDTVEYFNLVQQLHLTAQERRRS